MRRFMLPAATLVAGLLVGGTLIAGAVGPTTTEPVSVCINKWFGVVRVAEDCRGSEQKLELASHGDVAALAARLDANDGLDEAQQLKIDANGSTNVAQQEVIEGLGSMVAGLQAATGDLKSTVAAQQTLLVELAARVDRLENPPVDVPETEPNNAVEDANTFPLAPNTFSGTALVRLDSDYWSHTFPVEGTVTIDCSRSVVQVRWGDGLVACGGNATPTRRVAAQETVVLVVGAGQGDPYVLMATFTPDKP